MKTSSKLDQKDAQLVQTTSSMNEDLSVDSQSEIDLDASISTSADAKAEAKTNTKQKQLVSEQADSSEDNKDDL